MECYVKQNIEKLCQSLENKIEIQGVRIIEKSVQRKKMKPSLLITAKDAHKITSNKAFKDYLSEAPGSKKIFPLEFVASYLFEGKVAGGQTPSKGQIAEAPIGSKLANESICDGAEIETSGRDNDLLRETEPVLGEELRRSRSTEDKVSSDVMEVKGLDKDGDTLDRSYPNQDSGLEGSLPIYEDTQLEGEDLEENGMGNEVRIRNSPVNKPTCDKTEKEPSVNGNDLLRGPEPVLGEELRRSRSTEDKVSSDVMEVKGLDKDGDTLDRSYPNQDSGLEGSLPIYEDTQPKGQDLEENGMGHDGRKSERQRMSEVPPSPSSQAAGPPVGNLGGKAASRGSRPTGKAKKNVYNEDREIREKMEAKEKWLDEQVRAVVKNDASIEPEEAKKEMEESLELVHIREHPRYCALQARSCLVYTIQKEKVLLLVQLPKEPGSESFSSQLKNGDLKGEKQLCLQYNMGVLGGLSRADVVFYSRGRMNFRHYSYDRIKFDSVRSSLEKFIEEGMLPLLAVYLREQRKRGVFLDGQD
ncbi:uncharacterized protein LOC119958482 [Scyliorhinus canicula]|uniref:uncharacterized protein LOC119958482 n=1 Tax=Scyliorhinus canicula TaxID=7830 RepID=UPI0018F28EC9|nr:uncharacterized protein LOC119958482 [Scyliorhinus canicula]